VNFDKPLSIKEEVFVQDTIVLAITINGKKRSEIEVAKDLSQEEILVMARENAQKYIENKEVIKEIIVPNKLVNIVIKG
jgi:leucyl-tRNA synthetase